MAQFTQLTAPVVESYQGFPTIKIPVEGGKPITMGVFKIKMLMKELPEIRMALVQHRAKAVNMDADPYKFTLEGKYPYNLDITSTMAEALNKWEGNIVVFINDNDKKKGGQ